MRVLREIILYILNMCKWDWARIEGAPSPGDAGKGGGGLSAKAARLVR